MNNYIKELKEQIEELEQRLFELRQELAEKQNYQNLEEQNKNY